MSLREKQKNITSRPATVSPLPLAPHSRSVPLLCALKNGSERIISRQLLLSRKRSEEGAKQSAVAKFLSPFSKATSPVSCLTPPPEVPAIHAIEPPLYGVQDASNQTDTPEDTEEQPPPVVKQEQNLSPCHVAQPGANMTTANFEIVASPERICNVVRITTTTTTVNPICGIVTKVDKAENTIINMADCAKYSAKEGRNLRAIEHDSRVDEELGKEDKVAVCRDGRIGARIIEITEENCDSFHENLEFFARRRDVSADQRDRRDGYSSKDDENVGKDVGVQNKAEVRTVTVTRTGGNSTSRLPDRKVVNLCLTSLPVV